MSEKKEAKIIVKTSDELSDIVGKVSKSDKDRIILTFTEPSDLLISAINLTVIRETAQEESKSIIVQIIKNPTGERNAQKAGLLTINTPSNPTADLWEKVEQDTKDKQIEKEEKLGQRLPQKKDSEEKVPEKSAFERKIEEALSKSTVEPTSVINKTRFVEEEGVKISLDGEITENREKQTEKKITPKDPLPIEEKVPSPPKVSSTSIAPQISIANTNIKKKKFKGLDSLKGKISTLFKFKKKEKSRPNNVIKIGKKFPKRYIILGGGGILVALLATGVLYYYFAPLVKVKMYVDSKSVSLEKTFTGSIDITDADLEGQLVPLITEDVEEDASNSITPTGTSVTGEKATGTVRVNYLAIGETLDLPAGSSLTALEKKFITLADLHLIGPSWTELSVEATEFGSEYNVPFETYFTIDGQDDSEVSGSSLADFAGGSKTEVTVLSQGDVDTATEALEKTAKEEAEGDLLDKHIGDGWEVIKDSIKTTVDDDSVETDIPIGTEATTANISLSVKVSALYYKKESLDDLVSDMLSEEAKNKDLFDTTDGMELELASEIEKDYTVSGSKQDNIKIKLEASGVVTPKLSKDDILSKLKGMRWGEGINYLTSFDYSDKQMVIGFEPSFFPDWLRYFPERQGRIMISTIHVEDN